MYGRLQGVKGALLMIMLRQQAYIETVPGKLEHMVTLILRSKLKNTLLINCTLTILEVEDRGNIRTGNSQKNSTEYPKIWSPRFLWSFSHSLS